MDWDHLFDDLEGQLASEWEAERIALEAESERLRISKLGLIDRLRSLASVTAEVTLTLCDGHRLRGTAHTLGADWIAMSMTTDPRLRILPLAAIASIAADHGVVLSSLEASAPPSALQERMTLGFVLRDLARRRLPVTLGLHALPDDERLHGTIDRAGVDHLDIALHEAGQPRRSSTVRGFRIVPFSALSWVRIEPADATLI